MKLQQVTIFWFRRDLRLNDNHGLFKALSNSENVLPIFIFDIHILNELTNKDDKHVGYTYDALTEIQQQLAVRGAGLKIFHDDPLNVFKELCSNYSLKAVYTNSDYEPYAKQRDTQIAEWLQSNNISFHSYKDQVIFEQSDILKTDGTPYTVYTPYSRVWKLKFAQQSINSYPSENLISNFHKEATTIPSLLSIGFNVTKNEKWPIKPSSQIISHYHQTRDLPAIEGTSRLSVALRFGTTSVRTLVKMAATMNETWLNELIWREFFMMILFHFPHVIHQCFKKQYENIDWRNNKEEFERWCEGKTGYPMVDAGMRQLNETGWMHNRVRMVTASFLTKHLLIDWRWGEAYFAQQLLDYELSSNNGNWQWAAGCGCDAAPYFRIFNPTEQLKKFDPEMIYTRRWIKNYSPNYIQPIVEHHFARVRALNTFKKGLNA